ncbi:hypothetical protein ACFL19_01835 [Pseudomonadota bacterium]
MAVTRIERRANIIATKMIRSLFVVLSLFLSAPAFAWDGVTDSGSSITVERYDHQGRGEGEVEFYDNESGEYRSGHLDMHPGGSGTITDYDTGESYDVDMD